ncbi:DUF58 domain-containing protein [Dermabacteraceae bacterium TAE3-ERU27]|nr:DUF58 domain-containing protein [Dermabacteraceae bacterium TAE3-ERU27]
MPAAASGRTAAYVRALLTCTLAALLAILTGRAEVLLLVSPLAVWLALAGASPRPQPATARLSASRTREGEACELIAEAAGPVTLAVPLREHTRYTPAWGAVMGSEAAGAKISLSFSRWGMYEVGPVTLVAHDPLFSRRCLSPCELSPVRVTPRADTSSARSSLAHPIGVTGAHTSPRRGDGSALADVRPFLPGDKLRRINWRVTSRVGELHTNATLTDRDTDVIIAVDTLTEVRGNGASSLDASVSALNVLARYYLDTGDRVGLHDFGTVLGSLRPRSGRGQYRLLTDLVAGAERGTARNNRPRPLHRLRGGSLVFVCSPLLRADVTEEVLSLIARGAQVVLVDTLPGNLADEADETRRLAWRLRLLERAETVARIEECGTPVIPWQGRESLSPVLASLSRQGARRRR